jgi:hypothetical protein
VLEGLPRSASHSTAKREEKREEEDKLIPRNKWYQPAHILTL